MNQNDDQVFKGFQFPSLIIQHSVWLYYTFLLSFRDAELLLAQRSIQGLCCKNILTSNLQKGELTKLGTFLSPSTIRNILKQHNITPVPVRAGSIGWQEMMKHDKDQIIACDFYTIETIFLNTIHVFFFIELGTRRIQLAGITANPNGHWVAQQARQLVWNLETAEYKVLIRDNDKKYSAAFDQVFESEGVRVVPTSLGAPNANAFAERWVRTVREECLDHILVLNECHLE